MPFFFQKQKITVSSITFFWHYRIFYNLSIDCSCLKKKYARKKMGVTVLIFEKREAKGQFEGKLLRLWCYSNYLSGTKNNGVQIRNTNLSLSTNICQERQHGVKNSLASNCRTPKLLRTVSSYLNVSIFCYFSGSLLFFFPIIRRLASNRERDRGTIR